MGTSNSNPGQRGNTPLVPSWLDDEPGTDNPKEDKPLPPPGDTDRFKYPRGEFTRYINSAGRDSGHLRRAMSSYVRRSLGGASNATQRLGAARNSSARLISILSGIAANGLNSTLEKHGFNDLIGRPIDQVFLGLVDYICPDGGRTDEGIARSAFIDLLPSLKEMGIDNIGGINEAQFTAITEMYFSNVIMQRLINDIGKSIIRLPNNIDMIGTIETHLSGFIQGMVSDAMANLGISVRDITDQNARQIVEDVYRTAYSILESLVKGAEE